MSLTERRYIFLTRWIVNRYANTIFHVANSMHRHWKNLVMGEVFALNAARHRSGRWPGAWVCAILCLAAACAWGQGAQGIAMPLYAGNVVPLHDECGRLMRGSPSAAGAGLRPLVEVRYAYTNRNVFGEVFAPGTNGAASEVYNPKVSTNAADAAGMGLNASTADSGLFCLVLTKRPPAGTRIFARAFNAPTAAEATFYADSAPVEVKSNETAVVFAFGAMQALNAADSDGDGLSDSHEALLGIDDRPTSDYDVDGMSDYAEWLAGTAPDDATSKLAFRLVAREPAAAPLDNGEEAPRPVHVKWQSVPGKKYQLQYVPALTSTTGAPPAFVTVAQPDFITVPVLGDSNGIVTAGAGEYEMEMWVDVEDRFTGTFRVRLVPE